MKITRKIDWFLIIVVILVVVGFFVKGEHNHKQIQKKEVQQPIEVTTEEISTSNFSLPTSYIGYAQQFTGVDIKPQISGFITEVLVNGGDYVTKDTPLFKIDNRTYLAAVEDAKANVNKAKADKTNAKSYYDRIENTSSGAVSQSEKDAATASYQEAKSAYNQALAQLKTAEVNLDYTTLTAPNNGYLGDVTMNVGDFVNSQVSLAYLLEYSPIKIVFSVNQKDFLEYQKQNISQDWITLKKRDDGELNNKVLRLFTDNQFNQDTSSVPIYLRVDNTEKNLLPGSYVNVIVEKPIKNGIAIDKDKIIMEPNGNYAYVLKDDVITKTPVTIGGYLEYQYYISQGLENGDLLITSKIKPSDVGKKAEVKQQ